MQLFNVYFITSDRQLGFYTFLKLMQAISERFSDVAETEKKHEE